MHLLDYALIAVISLASIAIGVYTSCTGGRQQTTREYVLGNRNLNLLPVAISILVSFWSAISLLGSPAEIFYFGSWYNATAIGISMACIVSANTFVPLFYELEITSVYEYLELRYRNRFIRYWTTVLYVLTSTLYLAVAQLAPAIALDAVLGIPEWLGILIIGCVSVVYTALGGIKAVIWSDVFQSVFIVIGLVALIIKAGADSGGASAVLATNAAWHRFDSLNWSPDPRTRLTVWTSTLGVMFGWIPWYGPNQAAFQRFASLPSLTKAKWSILLNVPGVFLLFFLLAFAGYTLFSFYTIRGCDPYSEGLVKSVNQLLPYYVKHEMNIPALPGIIVACILSGAFSTTSTVLNSQAAVTVIDFLQPYRQMTDRQATVATKWLVVAYGLLGSVLALASSQLTGISLKQISGSLLNATTGATLGIYLLATCVPRSIWQGAFAGSLVSLGLVGWICVGAFTSTGVAKSIMLPLATGNCTDNKDWFQRTAMPAQSTLTPSINYVEEPSLLDNYWYSISFQWYGLIGAISCLLVGLLVSLPNMLDSDGIVAEEKHLLPVIRRFVKCRFQTEISGKHGDLAVMSSSSNSDRNGSGYDCHKPPPLWESNSTQESTYL